MFAIATSPPYPEPQSVTTLNAAAVSSVRGSSASTIAAGVRAPLDAQRPRREEFIAIDSDSCVANPIQVYARSCLALRRMRKRRDEECIRIPSPSGGGRTVAERRRPR